MILNVYQSIQFVSATTLLSCDFSFNRFRVHNKKYCLFFPEAGGDVVESAVRLLFVEALIGCGLVERT